VNSPSGKLGVGVIGLGVGEQHARAYAGMSECELRWLFDLDTDRADKLAVEMSAGKVAESFESILADSDVSIVSIASFDHLHFAEVVAAFEAGKHVFVEKPLCRTADELKTLQDAWTAANRPHIVSNLVLRQAQVYGWLKQAIEDGTLGRIYSFDGDYLYGRLEKITEGWRQDVPDYSVMEGGGIHLIDLMLWLTGERPARATTLGNAICTEGTKFGYDDFMATTFEFPSGLIGRITANFGCVHRHHHAVRVFGTKATFIYDDMGPRLHTSRDENSAAEALDLAALPEGKGVLVPGFVHSIINGADATPAASREFDLISACTAADRSHAKKESEEIEYL